MKKLLFSVLLLLLISCFLVSCDNVDGIPDESADVTENSSEESSEESSEAPKQTETPATDFEYTVTEYNTIFINKYKGTDKHVVIPSHIDGIEVVVLFGVPDKYEKDWAVEGVFQNTDIETVVIPKTVVSIGYCAFDGCKNLSKVTIEEGSELKTIDSAAFRNCIALEEVNFKDTKLNSIGDHSFRQCTSLKEIILPDTVTIIKARAFLDCTALAQINLSAELAEVELFAFQNCTSLKTITIPPKLRMVTFEGPAFYENTSLETIIFEEGREEIAGYIFFAIDRSVEIVIPASIKKISCATFSVTTKTPRTPIKITFLGNCPEIVDNHEYLGDPTIYYDPATDGWDECIWRDIYEFKEIE